MEKNAYSVSCQLVSTHAKLNVLTKWLKKKNIMMSEIVEQEITNLQVLLIDQLMLAFCLLLSSSFTSVISLYICLAWFVISALACEKYVYHNIQWSSNFWFTIHNIYKYAYRNILIYMRIYIYFYISNTSVNFYRKIKS